PHYLSASERDDGGVVVARRPTRADLLRSARERAADLLEDIGACVVAGDLVRQVDDLLSPVPHAGDADVRRRHDRDERVAGEPAHRGGDAADRVADLVRLQARYQAG